MTFSTPLFLTEQIREVAIQSIADQILALIQPRPTWAWAMEEVVDGTHVCDIGSTDPVRRCLQKNVKLSQCESGEICAEFIK